MELFEYNIVDALDCIIDYRGRTPKKSEGGIPTLSAKSVKMGYIDYDQCYYISKEEYDSFMVRGFPRKGDILFTTEAPLGLIAKLDRDDVAIAQRLLTLRGKEGVLDNNYLLYYLQSSEGQQRIMAKQSGSTVMGIRQEEFRKINIRVPEYKVQKKIASVLTALDDKIALNKKMNQKLEAMAKRLYDYWFVQFDFPDENGHPYKTSGGPMTYNPTLNREIPEGWNDDFVGQVSETVLGGTPSTENESFWNGDIPWLNSGEVAEFPILQAEKSITEEAIKRSATAYLSAGSVTLSITRHLRPSILAINACINQSVAGIKENSLLKNSYLYPYLVNEIPRLNSLRGGAQQPHINKDTVDKSHILIPSEDVLNRYYEKAAPIYAQIIEMARESLKLIALRDKLLPLLMNGQVEVK